jgi:hypothetical protein
MPMLISVRCLALLTLLLTVGMAGCSTVQTHRYADVNADLLSSGRGRIAVAVHDRRHQVLNREYSADTTGVVYGFFGNASLVSTTSGSSLAEDMARAICDMFKRKGWETVPVVVAPTDSEDEVTKKLIAAGVEKIIHVDLNEWHTSTWERTAVKYDFSIEIGSTQEKRGASVEVRGRESLGGSFISPYRYAELAVPRFFKRILEEAFNDPNARANLS